MKLTICIYVNKLKVIILLLSFVVPASSLANPDTLADRLVSMALQGDLSTAYALFDNANAHSQADSLASQFEARFINQSEEALPGTGDAFADAVIQIYRDYWVLTLTRRVSVQEGTAFLERSLLDLLQKTGETETPGNATEAFDQMGAALRTRGFRYLAAQAPPLHDLFLWKSEETRTYTVRLTDRTQPVQVTFISEIYSMGWKEFATLGLVSTTGWVEGARLYCIDRTYDRSSEEFSVSYLKHESRHLADFERFPGLSSSELEYRAKLTELAFASTTLQTLLEDFLSKSAPAPDSPHALANYRVSRELYLALYGEDLPGSGNPWQNIDPTEVNKAAENLLRQNTETLAAANQ